MIHLFHPENTNYETNGDVILLPTVCDVTAGINRTWQVDIEHPIDPEGRWKSIEIGAVIKCKSFNGTQLWRIVQTEKSDSGMLATCDPIFYDAAQEVVFPSRITLNNATCQQVLDRLCQGTKYSGVSHITDIASCWYENENLVETITGNEHGIVKQYDCEVGFDNYSVIIEEELGEDRGYSVLYGKNMPVDGISEAVNIDGTVTRLIPISYNGYKLPELYVDSPLIDNYPMPRIGFKVYENLRLWQDKVEGEEGNANTEYFNTKAQLYAGMREAAALEFSENEIDKPSISIDVNMVLLQNTEEYKEYKDLESVAIGDYVLCKNKRLGIEIKTRVRQLVYDCLREAVKEVELGDAKRNYFDNVSSTVDSANIAISPNGTVKAEKVQGTMDGSMAQMKVQNTADTSKFARLIYVEDLTEGSPTYGAISLGTPGLQLSNEREGNDWKWETAVTPDGIVADLITAGVLKGIKIVSEDPNIPLPISVQIDEGTVTTKVVFPNGDEKTSQLSEGMLILRYNQLYSRYSPEEIYISNGTTSTLIEPGVISVHGDPGVTDSIAIGDTTLEFAGGILVGVS